MKRIYILLVTVFFVFVGYQYISGKSSPIGDAAQLTPGMQEPSFKQPFDLLSFLRLNFKDALRGAFSKQDSGLKNPTEKKGPTASAVPTKAPVPRVNVEEVNRQLQDIIKLNDALKVNQVATAAEIQQIQEQAKIHQRLLQKLESGEEAVNRSEVNEVLRQEKIRIIREQTSRNSEIVKTLERQRRP